MHVTPCAARVPLPRPISRAGRQAAHRACAHLRPITMEHNSRVDSWAFGQVVPTQVGPKRTRLRALCAVPRRAPTSCACGCHCVLSTQAVRKHGSNTACVQWHLRRWWNHLSPQVKKGPFSQFEDAVIVRVSLGPPACLLGPQRCCAHLARPHRAHAHMALYMLLYTSHTCCSRLGATACSSVRARPRVCALRCIALTSEGT